MRRLVIEGARHPYVRLRARQIAASYPGAHPVDALFRHVRSMPYVRDETLAKQRGLPFDTSEILQGAPYQLQQEALGGRGAVTGDCDCRVILLHSMCEAIGYPTRFVVVRGPGRPDFSHVFGEVHVGDRWAAADTIMNGEGGRPLLELGQEIGPPVARDRTVIPLEGLVA